MASQTLTSVSSLPRGEAKGRLLASNCLSLTKPSLKRPSRISEASMSSLVGSFPVS